MAVMQVTDSSFEKDVLKSTVPVLVDFWAEWCGPCKRIAPTIDALASEFDGRITVGKLNFLGWKRLTVAVPPGIKQADYHYVARNGLQFLGFRVDCDLDEAYGRFYLYFDDLSAVSDLFLEKSRDRDDMQDIW